MSILATLVIAPSHAYGAEYSFEPSVVWRNELNDNYRYNTQSKQSAWISTIAPEMRAVRNTETGMIGVGAGYGLSHFSVGNPSNLSSGFVSARARERDERNSYEFDARFIRDTTTATTPDSSAGDRVPVLLYPTPNRPSFSSDLVGTGVVQDRVQRNLFAFAPSYTRVLDERWSTRLDGFYQQSRYERTGDNGLNDFNNWGGTWSLIHVLSPRTTVTGAMSATRYRSVPVGNNADQLTGNLNLQHRFSETFAVNGSAGYFRVNTDLSEVQVCRFIDSGSRIFAPIECLSRDQPLTTLRPATHGSDNGHLLSLGLVWNPTPTRSLSLNAREVVNPSGSGVLIKTTAYQALLNEQLNATLAGGLDLQHLRSHALSGGTAFFIDSEWTSIAATLSWKMTQSLGLDGGLRHAEVRYPTLATKATQNSVFASIRYDWPKISVSR